MRISDWSTDVCSSDLPQLLIATDIVNPPGVIRCRSGAASSTARSAGITSARCGSAKQPSTQACGPSARPAGVGSCGNSCQDPGAGPPGGGEPRTVAGELHPPLPPE